MSPDKCEVCGVDAVEGQSFTRESITFSRAKLFCPNCHARLNRRFFEMMLVGLCAAALLGIGLIVVSPESWLARFLVNFALLQCFLILAVIPHELGHALAGRFLGFEVPMVIIGFGDPIAHVQILGFRFELRHLPFGGLTIGIPDGKRWLRTRWFFFGLAGPAVNLLLGALVLWLAAPNRELSFRMSGPLNPIGLFALANILVVVENLIPFRSASIYGTMASDGMILLELLFGGQSNAAGRALSRTGHAVKLIIKWSAVVTIAALAMLVWWFAWVLFKKGIVREHDQTLWSAVVVFGSIGVAFAWLAYRASRVRLDAGASRNESYLPGPSRGLSPYAPILNAWEDELRKAADVTQDIVSPEWMLELKSTLARESHAEIEARLRERLASAPTSVALRLAHAMALVKLSRYSEAIRSLDQLVSENCSSAARCVLTGTLLTIVVKSGDYAEARARCERFLSSSASAIEKVYVLDCLACLTHEQDLKVYLPDADRWSLLAVELAPQIITLKGTRGAVLADLGRFSEAKPLLKEVCKRSEADNDKGISSLYLALCAKAEGDLKLARKLAKCAARTHPQPWLLERIRNEQLG